MFFAVPLIAFFSFDVIINFFLASFGNGRIEKKSSRLNNCDLSFLTLAMSSAIFGLFLTSLPYVLYRHSTPHSIIVVLN